MSMSLQVVQEVDMEYNDSAENDYKVPQKQWKKWSKNARKVFNTMYSSMQADQGLFMHVDAGACLESVHWEVTAWNAAWVAAEAVRETERES